MRAPRECNANGEGLLEHVVRIWEGGRLPEMLLHTLLGQLQQNKERGKTHECVH